MLKQRVITAIVLAFLFLAALFGLSNIGFAVAIGAVVSIAGWEWANMAGFERPWQRYLYGAVITAIMVLCSWYLQLFETGSLDSDQVRTLLLVACTWWALALLWVQGYPSSALLWSRSWLRALMGILVLVPAWLATSYLHTLPHGQWLIVLMILTVACADIGAYFSGKAFGRRKLAPSVSPGKTWEGVWGGFTCCLILGLAVALMTGNDWIVLAIIAPTSLASVLGDLLESMVKRERGIKDSSQLLPGHGGILDRIDGITAAAPVFALALVLTGWQA